MISFHEIVQAGFDDRQYGVTDRYIQVLVERLRHLHIPFAAALVAPVFPLKSAEDIACVGEGRHPLLGVPACIPSDVVQVEMGA